MHPLTLRDGRPVRRIAFGAEQLGGFQWGALDVEEIECAVAEAAHAIGVLFDTADCYGRGASEQRLGRVLRAERSNVFIATKFGVRFDGQDRVFYDNDPDYAEASLEASLRRLNTPYIDLFQAHWPDRKTSLHVLFERLERLRDAGLIRGYGVCNFPYDELADLEGNWPGWMSFSGRFSLLHCADLDRIEQLCRRSKLAFLGWGTLGQGLLSGKYGRETQFSINDRRTRQTYEDFHGAQLERNLEVVAHLSKLASHAHATPAQLAIRYVLEVLPSSITLAGVKSRAQLRENMGALTIGMDADTRAALLALPVAAQIGCHS